MPWDGTVLRVAVLGPNLDVGDARVVAGGTDEWVSQPRWAPDGRLFFTSDGGEVWSKLYADDGSTTTVLCDDDAEFSGPDWVFGQSSFDVTVGGTLVASWPAGGVESVGGV